MNLKERTPVNWWLISASTVIWLSASVMTLTDVWWGLWRSYPTSAGEITDRLLGRQQMMFGLVAFTCLLFAYTVAPKRHLPTVDTLGRGIWFGRAVVAIAFCVVAVVQVMASGSVS